MRGISLSRRKGPLHEQGAFQRCVLAGDVLNVLAGDVLNHLRNRVDDVAVGRVEVVEVVAVSLVQLGELRRQCQACLLYTSPSPRDQRGSRMPSSA